MPQTGVPQNRYNAGIVTFDMLSSFNHAGAPTFAYGQAGEPSQGSAARPYYAVLSQVRLPRPALTREEAGAAKRPRRCLPLRGAQLLTVDDALPRPRAYPQGYPLSEAFAAIGRDHHMDPIRQPALDRAMATRQPAMTDFTVRVADVTAGVAKAVSGVYAPIQRADPNTGEVAVVGFSFLVFQWSALLAQALPTFMEGFEIVVTSPLATYTFGVVSNNATDLGKGAAAAAEEAPLRPAHLSQQTPPACELRAAVRMHPPAGANDRPIAATARAGDFHSTDHKEYQLSFNLTFSGLPFTFQVGGRPLRPRASLRSLRPACPLRDCFTSSEHPPRSLHPGVPVPRPPQLLPHRHAPRRRHRPRLHPLRHLPPLPLLRRGQPPPRQPPRRRRGDRGGQGGPRVRAAVLAASLRQHGARTRFDALMMRSRRPGLVGTRQPPAAAAEASFCSATISPRRADFPRDPVPSELHHRRQLRPPGDGADARAARDV